MDRVFSFLLVVGALVVATSAFAAPSSVRIVHAKDADAAVLEATTRLELELRSAGFEVTIEETDATDPRAILEAQTNAFASIAILSVGDSPVADVWVVDHVSDKTLVRRVNAESGDRPRTLAIRAVELLRASLLEVESRPPPVANVPVVTSPVPHDVAHWMEKPHERVLHGFSLSLGGTTTLGGNYGPTLGPVLRVSYAIVNGFVVRASFLGPTFGEDITGTAGYADAHQIFGTLDAVYVFGAWRVSPIVAIGFGVADTFATGHAAPTFEATTAHGASFVTNVSAGAALRLTESVGVIVDTGFALIAPSRPIRIAGVDAGNTSAISWVTTASLTTSF